MTWRVRGGELPLSLALVAPELHYGQISTTQKDGTSPFPRRHAHSRTLNSAWSLLLDAQSPCVVLLVVLGLVRCLRWNMGTKLGRSQLALSDLWEDFPAPERYSVKHLTRHVSTVKCGFWSDSPRDQAVPKSVEAVTEDCTESHQIWNEMLGEQSRSQVGTALPAAMGPLCARHLAWSQPLVGTQSAQVGHLGVEPMSVISGFYAESSAVVQGKSCVERVPCAKHTAHCLCRNSWFRWSGLGDTCYVHQHAQQAGIFLFWSCGHQ